MKGTRRLLLKLIVLFISVVSFVLAREVNIPVNVNLEANWRDVPFELEVIEAIAAENSSAYYPLLDHLAELIENEEDRLTDKEIYDTFIDIAVQDGFISQFQKSFIDYDLALRSKSALVEAHYQYYDQTVLHHFKKLDKEKCETWFWYNSEPHCNSDDVFTLKTTVTNKHRPEIFSFDRILGDNGDAPFVILYADIKSRRFPVFHRHLQSSALSNKIRYIIRYKPSLTNAAESKLASLSGYGVELVMKKDDYIVIDDRNSRKIQAKKREVENHETLNKDSPSALNTDILKKDLKITKRNLRMLGLKAVEYITQQTDKFAALREISLNFPKYTSMIGGVVLNKTTTEELHRNAELGLVNGQNTIYINNAPLKSVPDDDVFGLQKLLNIERKHVQNLMDLGISSTDAVSLITANVLSNTSSVAAERYDYRSESLIWLNDLELDTSYSHWSSDVNDFLAPNPDHQLHEVRNNCHTLVFAIDFSNEDHLSATIGQIINLLNKRSPIQIALIPLVDFDNIESLRIAQYAMYLYYYTHPRLVVELVGRISNGATPDDAFAILADREPMLKNAKVSDVLSDYYMKNLVEKAMEWADRLDVRHEHPIVITNGIIVPLTKNWLHVAATQLENDVDIVKSFLQKGPVRGNTSLKNIFTKDARLVRNTLVNPADPLSQKFIDVEKIYGSMNNRPLLTLQTLSSTVDAPPPFTFWVMGSMNSEGYLVQLLEVTRFMLKHDGKSNINVNFVHSSHAPIKKTQITKLLSILYSQPKFFSLKELNMLLEHLATTNHESDVDNLTKSVLDRFRSIQSYDLSVLENEVDFSFAITRPNLPWVIAAGRLISPSNEDRTVLTSSDLDLLYVKEYTERFIPIYERLISQALDLTVYENVAVFLDKIISILSLTFFSSDIPFFVANQEPRSTLLSKLYSDKVGVVVVDCPNPLLKVVAIIDPLSELGQRYIELINSLVRISQISIKIILNPMPGLSEIPLKRFYRGGYQGTIQFEQGSGRLAKTLVAFEDIPLDPLLTLGLDVPSNWVAMPSSSVHDLDNIILADIADSHNSPSVNATYELKYLLVEGHCRDLTNNASPRGLGLQLGTASISSVSDTSVMATLGYFQLKSNPGVWSISLIEGQSQRIFSLKSLGLHGFSDISEEGSRVILTGLSGVRIYPKFVRNPGMELEDISTENTQLFKKNIWKHIFGMDKKEIQEKAEINIFTVASGHLYERFLSIMTLSVMRHTDHTVKFWLIENFLSPSFKEFLPHLAQEYGFKYELITYKWPHWLRGQVEKQRKIWGYKILFLDVLFPQTLDKVIFVDADQIVRTDLKELVDIDLEGAPYGYTPMCDSRQEIEGFRFWKQGYWKNFLKGKPYHISALYVIDLKRFRALGAGDKLRQHYQALSADPGSLSNLDQDLPNHLQDEIPIFSLPQEWLWCETWCSDDSLMNAKTIDLCNNPMTKEPKLDRARRQVPEWVEYDSAIMKLSDKIDLEKQKISHSFDNLTASVDGINRDEDDNEDDNFNQSQYLHDEL